MDCDIQLARAGQVTYRNFTKLGYERLTRGVYGRLTETPGSDKYELTRARFLAHAKAAMAACPSAILYGPTALQVLGVALPSRLEEWDTIHILVAAGVNRPERRDVIAHSSTAALQVWKVIDGLPVLHPVDHWAQMRGATMDELIEIGDGLVRRKQPLLSMKQLQKRVDELAGMPGVATIRRAAHWVRPGTDSLYESRTRMIIVHHGLPEPVVNLPVYVPAADFEYHIDMGYKEERVGVEFDGRQHGSDRRQMDADAIRYGHLTGEDWFLIRVTATQLSNPRQFLKPLERALIMRVGRGETSIVS